MVLARVKSYMMPIAMAIGILMHNQVERLSPLMPYLIIVMLFLTFSNISFKNIHISRLHLWLLSIQSLGSVAVYLLIHPFNPIVAQGAMICMLAPTATSAPVITDMLGGNVESLTAYSLLCNLMIIVVSPVLFSLIGEVEAVNFLDSLWKIFSRVFFLLFIPLFCALMLPKISHKLHRQVQKKSGWSFYLWSVSLIIVTGKIVCFIEQQQNADYFVEISLAVSALIICLFQFFTGRRLGRIYGDTVAGGQGLGQKNTVLAIWMAQTYLNPISSIGPGSYVLWQNIVNSYQIWRVRRKESKASLLH